MKACLKYFLIIGLISLAACSHEQKKSAPATTMITVQPQSEMSQLFFSGSIAPLKMSNIISPADGSVAEMHFRFGDQVADKQELFIISSAKAQQDFREAVTNYLKAKDTYTSSQVKYAGQVELAKDGLVSKNDMNTQASQLANDRLGYEQAEFQLVQVINKLKGSSAANDELLHSLLQLNLEDKRVDQILTMKFNRLTIKSPQGGVALFPVKSSDSSSSDSSNPLAVGSSVKEGQVLLTIGDLTGFTVQVNVNEVDIDKIKIGMPAIITGVAFPNITLNGKVTSVALQASNNSSGGLPTFPITITVADLSVLAEQEIHVGMSAQVQINIQNPALIYVPINAVQQQNNQTTVMLVNPATGQTSPHTVVTGQTTPNSVAITSGLKAGDKIVVPSTGA